MSAASCGCDLEAGWVCEFHRTALPPMATPSPYAAIASALCDASNTVGEVLADIPCESRTDALRLRWTRLDKAIDDAMGQLHALEADDARRAAGDED